MTGWPRIQVGAGGRLDVAWSTDDGVFVRSRVAGTWSAAETVSTDRGGDIDFIRDGMTRHLVYGLRDETDTAAGVTYAKSVADGVWTVTAIDSGQDVQPRMAVDGAGRVHLTTRERGRRRSPPCRESDRNLGNRRRGPGLDLDAAVLRCRPAGHHHVAVGQWRVARCVVRDRCDGVLDDESAEPTPAGWSGITDGGPRRDRLDRLR